MKKKIYSWSRVNKVKCNFYEPENITQVKSLIKNKKNFLTFGNGRSYGDVCLNNKNLISMRKFKKILFFDKKKGIIEAEAGILMSELLPIILNFNFFLPVTSGTKFVTLGGMVANNIHGKNINENYFSDHIISLKLINPKGKLIRCTKSLHRSIFETTICGIGLTGVIYTVRFKLRKIKSLKLLKKNIYFKNLKNFDDLNIVSKKYEYSVTWINGFSKDGNINGVHFLTKHNDGQKNKINYSVSKNKITFIHKALFNIFNNYYFYRIFNFVFLLSHYLNFSKTTSLEDFFYIQDKFIDWNTIYGKKGFLEFHILVPKENIFNFLNVFFIFCKKNKIFANLIVLKRLKAKQKNIRFTGDGVALSFDFKVTKNIDKIKNFYLKNAKKYGYNFYFAKDCIVSKSNFTFNDEFYKFKKKINKINNNNKIKSLLSNRLGLTK